MTTLDDLLTPRSVALVGASDNPARIGGRPLAFFKNLGYEGKIFPVNPNRDKVQGIDAYPSLAEINDDVDFVLVAVPAKGVLDVMRQAVEKRVKTVMIFSSGFGEMSEDGQAMQDELTRMASESGVRVIGPNCLGVFNSAINFYPTFTSTIERRQPKPGGLAIASQSGAYGSHIFYLADQRGLDMTYWITTGNECDVHVAEAIKLLAEKEDVHAICAYAESIKDGETLVEGLEIARANRKPVILMKVGRSEVGAEAASSHTASLAGDDKVYDAVLKQAGCYRARTTEEALDIAYAARPGIYPAGRRVGLVTVSGGGGVLMADAAEDYGLDVAAMPKDAQAIMKDLVPFAAPRNPVDVTAQFFNDMTLVPKFTKLMLEQGNYDALIGFWTSVAGSPAISPKLRAGLTEAMAGHDRKLFIQSLVAPPEICKEYEDEGFPCFEDPSRAVATLAALMHFGMAFDAGRAPTPDVPALPALDDGPLGEKEAKAILANFGLPMVQDTLATSADEAASAAAKAGGPVALKIASADILHKTEVGGVELGVTGDDAVRASFERIMANAKSGAPNASIDGIIVSPMVEDGIDCILGAKLDPVFGPIVMFGLGGIFTEIMGDVSLRRAPVSQETALEMIDDLKGRALFEGARGAKPVDKNMLAKAISQLSVFAAAHADTAESIEMNPLRVLPDRCVALDALIVKKA
ncbi:MAG: acetate--CoA ligase family protein [Hyphomicrobiaceae bacterium]